MVGQAFNVLTEFRFDIAHAVAGSQTLQSEIGKISTAADNAHYAIQRIGVGLVAQMGLGEGGILGGLYQALKSADKFASTQRAFANVFLTNGMFKGANSFEDSMTAAADAMEKIRNTARQFSIPAGDLVNLTKLVSASLLTHGLDDSSLTKSIDLSRGVLKSAPVLGIDPGLVQGQLLDAVNGRASMGDTLFQRLMNETSAMKPYSGGNSRGGAGSFNALPAAKRVDVLTKSLLQFGSVSQIVTANALSMSGQLQRLSDNFTSMFSVLKPIGDALMGPIKMILLNINNWLDTKGRKTVEIFAGIIKDVFADPEKLFVNIQQLRRLQGDVHKAGKALGLYSIFQGIVFALEFLGVQLKGGLLMTGLRYLGTALAWLGGWFMRLGGFSLILRGLSFLISGVLAPLALFTMFFQIISRALAKAELFNAKWLLDNTDAIALVFAKLKKAFDLIMLPITLAVEQLSDWVSWLFRMDQSGSFLLPMMDSIANMFLWIGKVMVHVISLISGMMNALIGQAFALSQGNFKSLFSGNSWSQLADEGYKEFWNRFNPDSLSATADNRNTSNRITHIDTITINNSFKEQQEPDRIAFTLQDQLMKAATNPGQARGRSLKGKAIGD